MSILISVRELAARIESGMRTVVLDARWTLAEPHGLEAYRAGHIPTAVSVDVEDELSDHGVAGRGRHPLPTEAAFTDAMRRWGIRSGDLVVVTDTTSNQAAARAWWLLRHAGHESVLMLDGGIDAWVADGYSLETGVNVPEPGDATAHFGAMPVIDIDEAAALPDRGVLLDVRAAERYRGEVEPVDPKAGHIPGAVSSPTTGTLDADGRFLAPDVLAERFAALGVVPGTPVAASCGSGVAASHQVAALAIAGIDAALFPGSWSQWSNDDSRPVATGSAPR
ncbi:sulfurtransferase [Agromyces salentinus]|uniref:Sulfurtransferase n=1 Tax=Agromyces salentinus TaxID=269421 RepID=A0ABN2MK45_9MICO|nr:sulfurtransferase [Agromyces salentinus]